jgi:hypothetical protein
MTSTEEMIRLRELIAQTVIQRDALKLAVEEGSIPLRRGLRELDEVDTRLSALDTRFKHLWDSANPRNSSG